MMDAEILVNHEQYVSRKALYQKYGYDVDSERAFVIEKAGHVSGRILEAGTGKGHFTLALARKGHHFVSFDLSPDEQRCAFLNLKYYGLENKVQLDIANAETLSYAEGTFDVIFSVNMIHHLSSGHKACSELIRVLTPTGRIIVSDFNKNGLAIIDAIHVFEGRKHEVGPVTLDGFCNLLMAHDYVVENHPGVNQDTLIAYRRQS
jgi:2-polyprenyl-3-methyl-5-hydroxy-6-metoxy-1,4-benzoquinol methylase